MKKLGLLLATMLFVLAVNAQAPEKKECCKDKAKTECCAKDKDAQKCDKSKDGVCCASKDGVCWVSKDKDAKKCDAKTAQAGYCCKDRAKAAATSNAKKKW